MDALDEFNRIASHAGGRSGSKYNSSNGIEFVTWYEIGDEHPQPESPKIKVEVREDGVYEGYYRFSMTLPWEAVREMDLISYDEAEAKEITTWEDEQARKMADSVNDPQWAHIGSWDAPDDGDDEDEDEHLDNEQADWNEYWSSGLLS